MKDAIKLTPTRPGKYFCQPFWDGKNLPRQEIQCYFKKCFIQEDIDWRTELVCDYKGYIHLVVLTTNNKWEL